MTELPPHLRKYVVSQDDRRYRPVDQAVWRYILRQLRNFLTKHAHESYLDGLEKTGISIESIPRIADISEKLSKFGWRALPVSGFIPPTAFMELQALNVLPIASEMRTLEHLLYTPAPDIVHEAAGHAPLLANPEYADYLKRYAKVASKSLMSHEDLDVYEAIRKLSDLKESPESAPAQIKDAEKKLEEVSAKVSHVSEAAQLGRMNWWTAEYGLIGSLDQPRIFGAGLLSSVGESKWCLSDKVRKIPLTVDCVEVGYDITEPQPQLFVTPDFKHLNEVLDEFADRMAFRKGGVASVMKAVRAQTVNTVELDSGLQMSGQAVEVLTDDASAISFVRFQGPSQLSFRDKELAGHDTKYHSHGFSTILGSLKAKPGLNPAHFSDTDWKDLGVEFEGAPDTNGVQRAKATQIRWEYANGAVVTGTPLTRVRKDGATLTIALTNARAELRGRTVFEPAWGSYDIAFGLTVTSVFGGAADRLAYGETMDFVASRIHQPNLSDSEKHRDERYAQVRGWRESGKAGPTLKDAISAMRATALKESPEDWLVLLEMHELAVQRLPGDAVAETLKQDLAKISVRVPTAKPVIDDGLSLAAQA